MTEKKVWTIQISNTGLIKNISPDVVDELQLDYNHLTSIDQFCPLFNHLSGKSTLRQKSRVVDHIKGTHLHLSKDILIPRRHDVLPLIIRRAEHFALLTLESVPNQKKLYNLRIEEIHDALFVNEEIEVDAYLDLKAGISILPSSYDFRSALEGNKDISVMNLARKILNPVLASARDFLCQNVENSEFVHYFINFFMKPTHPILKLTEDLCNYFIKPKVTFINLVLLRLFFPPLFESKAEELIAQRPSFKNILKVVYDKLTGQTLIRELKNNNIEAIFNTLFSVIKTEDHSYGLKTYYDCFIGSQMVDWLFENMDFKTREGALDLCNALQLAGYIEHLSDSNKRSFQSKAGAFYRWAILPGSTTPIDTKKYAQNLNAIKEMLLFKRPITELKPEIPAFDLPNNDHKRKTNGNILLEKSKTRESRDSTTPPLEKSITPPLREDEFFSSSSMDSSREETPRDLDSLNNLKNLMRTQKGGLIVSRATKSSSNPSSESIKDDTNSQNTSSLKASSVDTKFNEYLDVTILKILKLSYNENNNNNNENNNNENNNNNNENNNHENQNESHNNNDSIETKEDENLENIQEIPIEGENLTFGAIAQKIIEENGESGFQITFYLENEVSISFRDKSFYQILKKQ